MDFLVVMLYVLGSILMTALIVLIVKLIISVNKVNALLDDVGEKMETVNEIFGLLDKFTDSFSMISDKVIDGLAGFIAKIFTKKTKEKENNEEDN